MWSDKILDLIEQSENLTTSDLQGAVMALVLNIQREAKKDLLDASKRLLALSEQQLDRTATLYGLANCDALAAMRAAIAKAESTVFKI